MNDTRAGYGSDRSTISPSGLSAHSVPVRFLGWAALLFVAVVAPLSLWFSQRSPAALVGTLTFGMIAVVAARGLQQRYPHARLGIANAITTLRAAIIAPFAVIIFVPAAFLTYPAFAWTVLALALFSLTLDGVDGFFARRQGLSSSFGARFDVEIDSLFALILALIAMQLDKAGAWVLVLGFARYAFVAAGLALPWLNAPLPERFTRKLVCVIQIAVLIGMLAPVVAGDIALMLAACASGLLVWSFAVDIIWLARQHR